MESQSAYPAAFRLIDPCTQAARIAEANAAPEVREIHVRDFLRACVEYRQCLDELADSCEQSARLRVHLADLRAEILRLDGILRPETVRS